MSEGDAAWSGWGAPPPRPHADVTSSDADVGGKDRQHVQPPTTTMSKNRMRRQRRGLIGNDPSDHVACRTTLRAPSAVYGDGNLYHDQHLDHGHCDAEVRDNHRTDGHVHRKEDGDTLYSSASSPCDQTTSIVGEAMQSPMDADDDLHEDDPPSANYNQKSDELDSRRHLKEAFEQRRRVMVTHGASIKHQHDSGDSAQSDNRDDAGDTTTTTASDADNDSGSDGASEEEPIEPDKRRAHIREVSAQYHNDVASAGRVRATADQAVAIAHVPRKTRHRSEASEGALTRILVKERPGECSSSAAAIIVEGDVLSCRTCGVSSTAMRSSRMGVYVGDGRVVHAIQRRQRGASLHDDPYYEVVQQTLQDFARGRTISADEWFRTRSEFPAAVRVRRALERVGTEWEVSEGLDNARASEDFALWTATGQSALTHADYRDDRDDCGSSTATAPLAYRASSASRKKRNRRNSDDRGIVARAVRVGSDSPPPVLARVHQPATASSLSAGSHAAPVPARPAPITSDYRHAVAGGIVGLYLGGPLGGAVGGAAGLLLDSMASLGRGWRL
ncbi:Endopeptidase domain containing protein [Pandoravirus neocaledonia]|uniref:Endopeptidase domain containing protein n=1 Tax=Pandoravirus neocaledonia TaxID=2107708 RepID=A0A2U7UB81_9VIRU|nr:Endopeptidase domain containing protein [Pandoravirus neocaledonia]AVK75694.1 Endopeptidase domain containing protein [Pandoravirus neocaledonia]